VAIRTAPAIASSWDAYLRRCSVFHIFTGPARLRGFFISPAWNLPVLCCEAAPWNIGLALGSRPHHFPGAGVFLSQHGPDLPRSGGGFFVRDMWRKCTQIRAAI
jgi:hypothetical protein